jgi:glycosyltransferase involved in cell wall biosynthesis
MAILKVIAMEPYLSIVVTSVDDSHGGDLLDRMQVFLTGTLEQCRRHRIPSELIVVEWRRPQKHAPLVETLRLPKETGPCAVRIIEVPSDMNRPHPNALEHAVAKNVGIRRSRGRFVLTASTRAMLPEEVMEFISGQYLRYSSLEWDDIAAKDGRLGLGKGWFCKEMDGSKPFRWFNNDAEISIQPHSDAARVLALDIEPGPGVNMGPTTLDVLDDEGSKVLTVRLANRRVVNIPVPNQNGLPVRLRLHVSGTGHRGTSDSRQLNARVLRCGLYETPMIARTWSVPKRIWWMLTRRAGSSLLAEVKCEGKWPDSPHLRVQGDFKILARTEWFEIQGCPEFPGGAHQEEWGLGAESLQETRVVESVEKVARRPRAMVAVDLIGAPLVWFFRSIPRPKLPEAGAFAGLVVAEGALPPLENPPRISIVTPSYQHGHFLEWTMRSVVEQGYANLEYVVMDGGSKDGTGEILARYKDRLHYCESAPDEGQADAVVRGFEHTTGEIMAYLNSDDLLAPGALDFAARYLTEHPEVDAIYSHRVFIDEENVVTRYWILPPHHSWMMERWDYIPQETCFWRRRIYEKVGGIDKSFQFALDYDLFVRFMREGRMERVNRFLGAFREHPSSKTSQQEGAHPEVDRVYQERGIHIADWHRLPQLAQYELLDVRSRKFAARGKTLPGALAGIGYDYNLVWGGRLTGPRSSSRSNSDTRRI